MQRFAAIVLILATSTAHADNADDLKWKWGAVFQAHGDELASMANGILQFTNSPAGGSQGLLTTPQIVAPELAAKIGWATQSDALLYVNL